MASRAADGVCEPDGAGGFSAIENGFVPELFLINASFAVGQGLSMERGGEQLVGRWIGEQVSGELFDGELIKRHVAVDGVDDPVAVAPSVWARAVFLVSVAVGVARLIEPVTAPALAEVGGREGTVDERDEGVRGVVLQKRGDLVAGWRKTREIVAEAFDQGDFVCRGRGGDVFLRESCVNDFVYLFGEGVRGGGGTGHGAIGPVLSPFGALGDPSADGLDVGLRGALGFLGRGHDIVAVRGGHACEDFAGFGFAGGDALCPAFERFGRGFEGREGEAALCGVCAVAFEAVFRENGLNGALKVDRAGFGDQRECREKGEEG